MTVLANVMRELVGLFVDDGALALAIVAIVALAGVMATLGLPLVAGAILLFGCLGVLLANTVSAGRR
jgi:2-keto-4-pentenoate hydratase